MKARLVTSKVFITCACLVFFLAIQHISNATGFWETTPHFQTKPFMMIGVEFILFVFLLVFVVFNEYSGKEKSNEAEHFIEFSFSWGLYILLFNLGILDIHYFLTLALLCAVYLSRKAFNAMLASSMSIDTRLLIAKLIGFLAVSTADPSKPWQGFNSFIADLSVLISKLA
jgi:hypothetical protein